MSMIQKVNSTIKDQTNGITDSDNIYVVDYRNINGGGVEILDSVPSHNCVHLFNENNIEVFYVAFKDNALKVKTAEGQVKQCECVLFPTSLNENDWVLFIETKYAYNLQIALNDDVDYPNTMINQIISTVKYFRDNQILPKDKRVSAIVSFPTIIDDLSEAFFTRSEKTAEEILFEHKILIRATNKGKIISPKRLRI